MNKDEIITALKSERQFLKDNYGVESIALFGSYAKGLEQNSSDIDFFVEFKAPSFNSLMDLYAFLESKLNTKIDIVRKGPHLSKRFLTHIEKELIYV